MNSDAYAMVYAANSVVMARSEIMTCIQILIYLQKLQSCYIGILLWTSYVKTARTVYYGRTRLTY